MVTVKNEGKTAFIKDVLAGNTKANAQVVNEAWKAAGHEGSISTTLVQKIRSSLGLTGNRRRGRKPTPPRAQPRGVRGSKAPVPGLAASGNRRVGRPAATPGLNRRLCDEIEEGIDLLLFQLMNLGGFSEVEMALRQARRLLVRSQAD